MIFIKPKKRKRGIYIKFLATSSEIQICRIRITGKNKQNKIKTVSSSRSSLSFIEELEWNRRLLYSFTGRRQTQTPRLLLLAAVVVVEEKEEEVVGGFGQQLKLPLGRHGDGKSIARSRGVLDAGRISEIVKGSFSFKKKKKQ